MSMGDCKCWCVTQAELVRLQGRIAELEELGRENAAALERAAKDVNEAFVDAARWKARAEAAEERLETPSMGGF